MVPGLDLSMTQVGTPLTDALASALCVDRRRSKGKTESPPELDPDKLIDLVCNLYTALDYGDHEFLLPYGSIAKSTHPGTLEIAGECHVLDAGRPGLFAVEETSRHAHGPNLDLLQAHIERLTRRLACRQIGLPTPHHIVDTDSRPLLQFAPFEKAGGVVLQRSTADTTAVRFCSATPDQILAFAEDIVLDMRALWTLRHQVGEQVAALRAIAEAAAYAAPVSASVRSIDLDIQFQRQPKGKFALYIEYNAVDEAMREGIVLDYCPGQAGFEYQPDHAPYGVRGRWKKRAMLNAMGADGMIDEVALRVLNAAPQGAGAVLAKLAISYETVVTLPTSGAPMFATLHWRNGVIVSEISIAGTLNWRGNSCELAGVTLPETVMASLPGRTVASLIDLPFECDCKIRMGEDRGRGLRLILEPEQYLINLDTGRVWSALQVQ